MFRRVTSQEQHQQAVLADYQRAVVLNRRAQDALTEAHHVAHRLSQEADEARKRLRRVADGGI